MQLRVDRQSFYFRSPVTTAFGVLHERTVLITELTDNQGNVAYGEAAPLEVYDGVSLAQTEAALTQYAELVAAVPTLRQQHDHHQLINRCRVANPLPQAIAAIDTAGWNMLAQQSDKPIAELLSSTPAQTIDVNATIAEQSINKIVEKAQQAVNQNFGCLKLKVGFPDDEERIAALRHTVGAKPKIRLDANGAWNVAEAVEKINRFESYQLELVEEPVHGVEQLQSVRQGVNVPIAMDETATESDFFCQGATDAVCLKLSRCGGVSGTIAAAQLARANKCEPYIASTFDGPVGIAAAIEAARVIQPRFACGLSTLNLFRGYPADS